MELVFGEGVVSLDGKVLSGLDEFVLEFVDILDEEGVRYVLISGYVAILFGRSRGSEDVDLILEKLGYERFFRLWKRLTGVFECINVSDPVEAYNEYLLNKTSIRFSRRGAFIPNMEVKFPKEFDRVDNWTLDNRMRVSVNGKNFFVSPMEVQLPFKIYLGSEKDIEDAKHLYHIFKDKMDNVLLNSFIRNLGVEKKFRRYLG